MKTLRKQIKKGKAVLLVVALLMGMLNTVPSGIMAVQAADGESSGNTPSVTAFATKEELMTAFTPNADGTATTIGKVVFGKDSSGNPLKWYILGKDSGITGDNTVIFTTSPIATGQVFENDSSSDKTFAESFGTYATNPVDVYPNHYGASDLRVTLQGLATNTDYFTAAEQSLMQATKVTTNDTSNSADYTTTDVLYAVMGDYDDGKKLWIGSNNEKVLLMSTYWSSGELFWLRTPYVYHYIYALVAESGDSVNYYNVDDNYAVRPASNLNLSSVIFASATTAATSDTVVAGTIEEGKAMTLRLDGSNSDGESAITVGEVLYDANKKLILAKEDASAGTVTLVVQGNDGTNDWYYSKIISGTEWISTTDIASALSVTDISLSDCKIWLETTDVDTNMIYASMAKAGTFMDTVAITGIDTPAGGGAFDITATSATTGLAATDLTVVWTKENEAAGEIADYGKTYTASITLTPAENAIFLSGVTATVDGNEATVTMNDDGTVTVTCDFTATKRKLVSIAAPAVPEGNRFTSEHTAENVLDSSELGATAQVTLEGTTEPITVDMDVEWSLANENDAGYDTASSATNIFKWIVKEDAYAGYDTSNVTLEGTVNIKNACTEHSPNADDGDCTTAITCSECGTVTTEAKEAHTPNEDDGDCTTAITCSECGTVTTEAGHVDENSDEKCDVCGSFIDGIGANLAGYTISLNGNIGVNFYMELDTEVANDSGAYMLFILPSGDTEQVSVADATKNTTLVEGKTYYVFSCEVASYEMTQSIKAQMFDGSGNGGKEYSYTVRDYAEYIINNEASYTSDDVAFAKAMLNYGACSQTYFEVETDNLANKNLDAADQTVATLTASDLEAYKVSAASNELGTFAGYSLTLKSETTLKAYFKLADGVDVSNLTFTANGQTVTPVKSGDYYVLSLENIKAWDLDTSYTFKVFNGSIELEFSCSALSYGYSVLNKGNSTYPDTLIQLISALRVYQQKSEVYVPGNN